MDTSFSMRQSVDFDRQAKTLCQAWGFPTKAAYLRWRTAQDFAAFEASQRRPSLTVDLHPISDDEEENPFTDEETPDAELPPGELPEEEDESDEELPPDEEDDSEELDDEESDEGEEDDLEDEEEELASIEEDLGKTSPYEYSALQALLLRAVALAGALVGKEEAALPLQRSSRVAAKDALVELYIVHCRKWLRERRLRN